MKKRISLLLCLLMCFGFLASTAYADQEDYSSIDLNRAMICPNCNKATVTAVSTTSLPEQYMNLISCIHGFVSGQDKVYRTEHITSYRCSNCGHGYNRTTYTYRYECHGFD